MSEAEPDKWHAPDDDTPPDDDSKSLVELYAGSLPHPAIIQGYEQVLSGAAGRILAMAEKQQTHRQGLERSELDHIQTYQKRYLELVAEEQANNVATGTKLVLAIAIIGLIIGLAVIASGTYLLYLDREVEGFAVLLGGLAALVWGGVRGLAKIIEAGTKLKQEQQSELQQQENKSGSAIG